MIVKGVHCHQMQKPLNERPERTAESSQFVNSTFLLRTMQKPCPERLKTEGVWMLLKKDGVSEQGVVKDVAQQYPRPSFNFSIRDLLKNINPKKKFCMIFL